MDTDIDMIIVAYGYITQVDKLRLAGLIGPKQRDLYDLTRAGRNVAVVTALLGRLNRDRRPRPVPMT